MWLVYLRFEHDGQVKTYHITAENKQEAQGVLTLAEQRGLSPSERLAEYDVFYSRGTIKPMRTPNLRFYGHREFTERWERAGK
jgi:hypothetical protein